ncbi:hypothetical protein D9M71_359310 [compost metagenome]
MGQADADGHGVPGRISAYPQAQGGDAAFGFFLGQPPQVDRELFTAQAGEFELGQFPLDSGGDALEHDVADIMAEGIVDLLEVVDVDHGQVMIVRLGRLFDLGVCRGHERAPVGDFGQGIDIGLVEQQPGHAKVVQFRLAHGEVAVDDQAGQEGDVADGHGATELPHIDIFGIEGVEDGPSDDQGGEERPAPQWQYRGAVEDGRGGEGQPRRA